MPSRSNEFRELVSSLAGSSSAKLPSESLRARRLRVKAAHTPLDQIDAADPTIDIWIVEARRVLSSLHSLSAFLRSIRRAYLDVSSSNATSSSRNKGKAVNKGQLDLSKGLLDAWRDIRWLDDRERDEVDYQAKTVLKSASQRVKELEQAEKNRHARLHSQLSSLPGSSFTRLLGLPSGLTNSAQASEDQLHAHRVAVALYLSRALADTSRLQKEQQEARINRQLEHQSMAAGSAALMTASVSATGKGDPGSKQKVNGIDGVPDAYVPAPIYGNAKSGDMNGYDDEDYQPIDSILTQKQMQQFESESSQLLQEANAQLASIEKAQASLLEISALQSELVVHLTQQSEITDKLWEDAVLVTGRVEDGNKELKQARERNREGRVWLLIFLLGASLSLLFLEYY